MMKLSIMDFGAKITSMKVLKEGAYVEHILAIYILGLMKS